MKEYLVQQNLEEKVLEDFKGAKIKIDSALLLYDKFVLLVQEGKKKATVRYVKDMIRIPESNILPLYETKPEDKDYKKLIGQISIDKLIIKKIEELTEQDGINDGFSGKDELIRVIKNIYGDISLSELV